MSLNSFYIKNIRKLSFLDFSLLKLSFFSIGLTIMVSYPKALILDWWAYLLLLLVCCEGLWIELFDSGKKKGLWGRFDNFIKNARVGHLDLLFLAMLFVSGLLSKFFPVLLSVSWVDYLIIAIITGIKPFYKIFSK
ncbi:MAG: hypothetical protein N4A44_00035 [Alphaproteobacteria bacterium]|jgi:hypothetical protein|nr:hypothetical protein [Alphaproteobacteria bacterium]